ncbi:non-homologous end-joining DNA ligase [Microbacterium keratanolyticum]
MAKDGQIVQIDGRRLRVTNLDKIVYPDAGTTKGDVISYYTRIAPLLLPQLAGRPVTRKRWVEGVGTAQHPGDSFFTKQLERGAPDWIRRGPIEHSGGAKEYPVIEEVAALAWLAQVASIELHTPQWRFDADGTRLRPDRMVLDLDPGPGASLAQCAEVARLARGILTGMGLDAVPVTSGSKGIHLYAALPGEQTSDEISAVARALAQAIESDHPDLVTSTMAKVMRPGKVFIDWSQNNGAKTTITPYSLRGRAHPWVAAPRTWEELEDPNLTQLTADEVLDRAAQGIDPFAFAQAPADPTPMPIPSRMSPRRDTPRPRTPPTAIDPDAASAAPLNAPRPMLATRGTPGLARSLGSSGAGAPSHPSRWAEIKWDGIRAIGTWRHGRFRLFARSGIEITDRYPELTADGAPHLSAQEAIVDGEIVALDATGRPSFALLQNRMHLTSAREIEREVVRTPIRYHLFDLMHLDGHDITALPLRDRRELLERVSEDADARVVVPPVFEDVDAALEISAELGLEGIVVKDAASRYRPGERSASWLKLAHTRTQEVVIGGIRPGQGDRTGRIGSLLLGVPDSEGLRYVGRVGTGFTDRMLRDLAAQLGPLASERPGLVGVPPLDASDAQWVEPVLVAEVEFANWTPGGHLRHPRWRGLRPDKGVDEIIVER